MSYWGYARYVPVAERRAKAEKAATKALKAGAKLSPIAPYRGAIAKTFWGKAWCDNLEHYSDYANRLPRGRTYVRNGSVIDLNIVGGAIHAKVMGSSLYTVKVTVMEVAAKQWQAIGADCSGSIDSMVELLQGKLTKPVMERICKHQTGLFPAPKDIEFSCSCPDSASMCKHIAAVLYGVGARLDQQPAMLFELRQVDAKDLLAQAATLLPKGNKVLAKSKVLNDAALADVFGLDMDDALPAPVPKAPKTKVAASKKLEGKPTKVKVATLAKNAVPSTQSAKAVKATEIVKPIKKGVKASVPDIAKTKTATAKLATAPSATAKRSARKVAIVTLTTAKSPEKSKSPGPSLAKLPPKKPDKTISKRSVKKAGIMH